MNIEYNKLYNYCVSITEQKLNNMQFHNRKKRIIQKNKLYNNLINNVSIENIKYNASQGITYYILNESKHNYLIEELLNELNNYFNPFKVLYVKKKDDDKSFIQTLTDENTYILYISWKKNKQINKINLNQKEQYNENNENNEVNENNENNEINENNEVIKVNEENDEVNEEKPLLEEYNILEEFECFEE